MQIKKHSKMSAPRSVLVHYDTAAVTIVTASKSSLVIGERLNHTSSTRCCQRAEADPGPAQKPCIVSQETEVYTTSVLCTNAVEIEQSLKAQKREATEGCSL